ncbi:GspE/PulE family protein [Desulfococcaceae bacterium HSG9]|nr:GspE/PulE family protein [Desulfococcaceae bacterium HSG9]
MPVSSVKDPFATRTILKQLIKNGYLSPKKAKSILEQKFTLTSKMEKLRAQKFRGMSASTRNTNPINIIDVIASLKLKRLDKPARELNEDIIYKMLADEWGYPYIKLDPLKLDINDVTATISHTFAIKHLVIPIGVKDGFITVVTPNPFNLEVFDDISRVSKMRVKLMVSSKADIIKIISEFFGFQRSITKAQDQFEGQGVDLGNLERYIRLMSAEEVPPNDQHIVHAVNHLLVHAFEQRASDIHVEPKRDVSRVRMRIDGVLHDVYTLPKKVHNAIISRIKGVAGMDMADKRRPQDGRIKTEKSGTEVEIRVSTLPVTFGEKAVMRIMDPEMQVKKLEEIGFSPEDFITFQRFIDMPHGIVLVCGPTGSGKSTTLYSALRHISTPDINITTVEDPIEIIHEDLNQIAVNSAVNITFGSILRTILRQDPDVIMIGEMRDLETAENAVQAALTGHLVLSTLHTNDAPSSVTRLLDLGIQSFLIQATLIGILSQRLMRQICNNCKETFMIDTLELRRMGLDMPDHGEIKLSRGRGCHQCRDTGYMGRIGIFEVLPFTESLKKITTPTTNLEAIRVQAKEEGMVTLRENGIQKMLAGETTYQEVLRVTWDQD